MKLALHLASFVVAFAILASSFGWKGIVIGLAIIFLIEAYKD